MKLFTLITLFSISALAVILPLKQMSLSGVDSDQLSCELEIQETGDRIGRYKITVNNSEVYHIIDQDFSLRDVNKVIRKSTKISSLNGEHQLIITAKPNGSISYKIIDFDRVHYTKNIYKCSALKKVN